VRLFRLALGLLGFLVLASAGEDRPARAGGCGIGYSHYWARTYSTPTYSYGYAPSYSYTPTYYPPQVYIAAFVQPVYVPTLFSTYQPAALSTFQTAALTTVQNVQEVRQVPVSNTTTTVTRTTAVGGAVGTDGATSQGTTAATTGVNTLSPCEAKLAAMEARLAAMEVKYTAALAQRTAPLLKEKAEAPVQQPKLDAVEGGLAVLVQRCSKCHDAGTKGKGGGNQFFREGRLWVTDRDVKRMYDELLTQAMPPKPEQPLTQEEGQAVVRHLTKIETVDKKE